MNEKNLVGDASYYETFYAKRPPTAYNWLLSEIITHGKQGNILDVGCGVGLLVALAKSWGIEAAGLDGSPEAIDIAERRFPGLNVRSGLLSEPLPFSDQSFDNVVLNQVIEHLPERILISTLLEVRRCLRHRGMIFIFSPSKANRKEILADPTHCNPQYPSELREMLCSAGFKVIREPNEIPILNSLHGFKRVIPKPMKALFEDWASLSANAYAEKM